MAFWAEGTAPDLDMKEGRVVRAPAMMPVLISTTLLGPDLASMFLNVDFGWWKGVADPSKMT